MLRLTPEEYRAHQARVKLANEPVAAKRSVTAHKTDEKVDYARELAKQIKEAGLPEPLLEHAFDAQLDGGGRGWRFDLCWKNGPRSMWLAVEVDGAVHRIKGRFKADLAKHQAAFALGYKLLRVSPEQVRNGEALELVRKAFD